MENSHLWSNFTLMAISVPAH